MIFKSNYFVLKLGWTGTLCQIPVNACSSNPCLNSGICTQINGNSYNCTCPAAWTGTNCELNVNECQVLSQPCQNSAICQDRIGSYNCICLPGYTGTFCQTMINYCLSSPCLNGGSCQQTSANFWTCACPLGYNGLRLFHL
jgi:Notch-like protein